MGQIQPQNASLGKFILEEGQVTSLQRTIILSPSQDLAEGKLLMHGCASYAAGGSGEPHMLLSGTSGVQQIFVKSHSLPHARPCRNRKKQRLGTGWWLSWKESQSRRQALYYYHP